MADIEVPSFSLGLDDSDSDDYFENLTVDDSEPDYPDPKPKIKRRITVNATSSYVPANGMVELRTGIREHYVSNAQEAVSTSCSSVVFPEETAGPLRRCLLIDSDSNLDGSCVSNAVQINQCNHATSAQCYFFHDDPRIQELVRIRLPNFSPLGVMPNKNLEQPSSSTSKIDYMGQFSCGESSKQVSRNTIEKKSSSSRKLSRKSKNDDVSQGWVNPKLGVDKRKTKGAVKRKVWATNQTCGHWVTGSDGKKVYVGKKGQELTGRVAYMQYKKESGVGFRKAKRKYATRRRNE